MTTRPCIVYNDPAHTARRPMPPLTRREDYPEFKDAAHECRHGRMAHDPGPPCGCFAVVA